VPRRERPKRGHKERPFPKKGQRQRGRCLAEGQVSGRSKTKRARPKRKAPKRPRGQHAARRGPRGARSIREARLRQSRPPSRPVRCLADGAFGRRDPTQHLETAPNARRSVPNAARTRAAVRRPHGKAVVGPSKGPRMRRRKRPLKTAPESVLRPQSPEAVRSAALETESGDGPRQRPERGPFGEDGQRALFGAGVAFRNSGPLKGVHHGPQSTTKEGPFQNSR